MSEQLQEQIIILEKTLALVKDQFEQYRLTTFSKEDWADSKEIREELTIVKEQVTIVESTLELVKDRFEQYKLTTFSKDDWKENQFLRKQIELHEEETKILRDILDMRDTYIENVSGVNQLIMKELTGLRNLVITQEKIIEWQKKIIKANNMIIVIDQSIKDNIH